jgi:hypothetical protein
MTPLTKTTVDATRTPPPPPGLTSATKTRKKDLAADVGSWTAVEEELASPAWKKRESQSN